MDHPRKEFMEAALNEARKGAREGQYALGAVVVKEGQIIASAHTSLHRDHDPSAHAEMNAIRSAANKIGSRYLMGCWLYTTQEPCPMCTSAAIWGKMQGIVFGAFEEDAIKEFNKKNKQKFTWRQIAIPTKDVIAKGIPKLELKEGFMREECLTLYQLNE